MDLLIEQLMENIRSYHPDFDEARVKDACLFQIKAHEGQMRASGEPYSIHPLHVAILLAELNMDDDTIIAGLLHDVIEDTDYTYDYIEERYGKDVAIMVDGVTKLKKIQFKTKQENQAENIRKMIMAMANDIRVIIIKLCDRLHNMRTLEYVSEKSRQNTAVETLEIYAPLAHRLGINAIKWELEDLSLRFLESEKYYELAELVDKKRDEREAYIEKIMTILKGKMDESAIEGDISGRPKSLYSIYKKMYREDKTFEQIFDLTAIRIITDSIRDCYAVLGIVHNLWKPLTNRFKDYIAMPKPNMYQSLHTTVIGPDRETFEVQIRTWDMHKTAEYGIAAHWKYKEQKQSGTSFDQKLTWLRQLMEWQKDLKDPKEFMETLKGDFFSDEVYVFTPDGDIINLPQGSTPIDFAYRVHTAIGNNCVGARIDGRIVPLTTHLQNGNIVEVITSASSTGPSRDWLTIVKSPQARNRIRQFFRKEDRDINIVHGREALEKEVVRLGYEYPKILKDKWLQIVAEKIGYSTIDDLYANIGHGSASVNQAISRLRDIYNEHHKDEIEEKKQKVQSTTHKTSEQGVNIKGVDNVHIRFAQCCMPVPGDDIIGYVTRGRGVSVHRQDCPTLSNSDPDRMLEVFWDNKESDFYNVEIQVVAIDRTGLLSEITHRTSEAKINVNGMSTRLSKDGISHTNLVLAVRNAESLSKVIDSLKNVPSVLNVFRVKEKG